MRNFTLATLAILVSAGSILTLSPSVKADTREAYCRHHQCSNYNHNYNYNRGYNRNYHARNDHRQYGRWYDSQSHTWHYGNR